MQYFDLIAMTITFTVLIKPIIHALQRGNYRVVEIWKILFTRYYSVLVIMQVVMFAVVVSPIKYQSIVLAVGCVVLTVIANRDKSKLPLRYTPRAVRLYITSMVLIFGVLWHIPSYLVPMFLPLVVLVAQQVILPVELVVNRYYFVKAQKRYRKTTAVKIAVTGSYGKTSVKHILAHLLEGVASPASYNTPMGLSKFANSCNMENYPYVVLEMGARHRGDIASLCRLCTPNMGVIVGVAPQHVGTLGGMAGVVAVKQELVHAVPSGGTVVLSGYDHQVASWIDVGSCAKVVSTDIVQCHVRSTAVDGSSIDVVYGDKSYAVDTQLIGVAHANNIALSLAVALQLGIDIDVLIDRVATLPSIPHRMQYVSGGVVHIIDDSYNANIEGVRLCCMSVADMNVDRRIVIAQGIVECGDMCDSINRQVGHLFAEVFDVVIVTGANSSIISSGCEGRCIVEFADSIDSAVDIASKYYCDNCLLVFSNDIP